MLLPYLLLCGAFLSTHAGRHELTGSISQALLDDDADHGAEANHVSTLHKTTSGTRSVFFQNLSSSGRPGVLEGSTWKLAPELGSVKSGMTGTVYPVKLADGSRSTERYVMKYCRSGQACAEEAVTLGNMPGGRGTLSLIDGSPKIRSGELAGKVKKGNAYVMPMADEDFDDWCKQSSSALKDQCFATIQSDLWAGLSAIHAINMVHQDIKADNVVVINSEFSCPRPFIIDFDLSEPKNSFTVFFDGGDWARSPHLVADIFDVGTEKLSSSLDIRRSQKGHSGYIVSPLIDWCSYGAMMKKCFPKHVSVVPSYVQEVDCGLMNWPGRRNRIQLTHQVQQETLDEMGQRTISSGKHEGRSFADIYDTDPGYVAWIISHAVETSSEWMKDFRTYCHGRKSAENRY